MKPGPGILAVALALAACDSPSPGDEIWAVLAFLKSHWTSPDILAARAEMLRAR